ncbi:MAG TPA: hypothetical protein VHO06_00050 [Polyangia bacterium]|nr:hypothetical protein [Polyangia bacterium]
MTPAGQLESFIAKFAPANQRLIRASRARLRRRFPAANELVYDNYNFLVVANCPTEKPGDSYFSIGADKNGANVFFGYTGTKLADPRRLLQGTGARNRFLRLDAAGALDRPAIVALLEASIAVSKPLPPGRGRLIVASVSPRHARAADGARRRRRGRRPPRRRPGRRRRAARRSWPPPGRPAGP